MQRLERFLRTHPDDAGCDETRARLHIYAEAILAGDRPGRTYPAIAAHLRDCPPCADELEGLLFAVAGRLDD
ncbi:MAG TPA: hypothetical protein VFM58_15730 [Solirubrobacteraceae bacterium]|nr:hypothetical protein [Solirubrobacteraceae bacterium]